MGNQNIGKTGEIEEEDSIDRDILSKSSYLAMTSIEEMEDIDKVKVLVGNLNDMKSRANERIKELMAAMKVDNQWFDITDKFDGKTCRAMWLRKQKNGKPAPCDNCGTWVAGNVRRLLVANDQGPRRNGHRHQFVCMQCASTRWKVSST